METQYALNISELLCNRHDSLPKMILKMYFNRTGRTDDPGRAITLTGNSFLAIVILGGKNTSQAEQVFSSATLPSSTRPRLTCVATTQVQF